MEREIKRYGLCSSLSFKCNQCGISIIVDLQPKESRGRLEKRHSINVASVWGFVSTGGGHAKMDEILSVMSIPSIDRRNFHSTEMFITKEWRQQLAQEMLERGKDERHLDWFAIFVIVATYDLIPTATVFMSLIGFSV